jgi:hypothetical protein
MSSQKRLENQLFISLLSTTTSRTAPAGTEIWHALCFSDPPTSSSERHPDRNEPPITMGNQSWMSGLASGAQRSVVCGR